MKRKLISISADVLGGTPVFTGTRVPVQTFIEYIEGGHSIDDFVEGFPTVKRGHLVDFLEEAKKRMISGVA
jgi:uncharacterized protein (DUF433 family)